MSYPYIITPSAISLVIGTKPVTIPSNSPNYQNVISAIKAGDWDRAITFMDIGAAIVKFSEGHIKVSDGLVTYKDQPIYNAGVDRILRMMEEGFDVTPMVKFMDKLMENPSETARKELWLFLEHNDISLWPDGDLLAYKYVRKDYKDQHTGTIDNSVGQTPTMDRGEVDPIRDNLCSTGLHFCALHYLSSYGNGTGRCMILKINPKDVVSIPSDYNNAKGRTCRYEVVAEYTDGYKSGKSFSDTAVVTFDLEDSDPEYYTVEILHSDGFLGLPRSWNYVVAAKSEDEARLEATKMAITEGLINPKIISVEVN